MLSKRESPSDLVSHVLQPTRLTGKVLPNYDCLALTVSRGDIQISLHLHERGLNIVNVYNNDLK